MKKFEWFRHGERMPTNFAKFKTDPPFTFDYADLAYPSEMTKASVQFSVFFESLFTFIN